MNFVMGWRLFVALRYFKTRSRDRFISIIGLISVFGVAIGVAALIIVIAVMSGFSNELKRRIIGTSPHIYIEREGGIVYPDANVSKALAGNKNIVSSSPFVTGQVLLKYGDKFTGAVVNGIDEETEQPGILVGRELAKELGIKKGDDVSIVSAGISKPQNFKVINIFHTGLYSFDAANVFVSLETAQKLFNMNKLVSGIAVRITDELKANKVKLQIRENLGFPYFVISWMDRNKNLFSALMLEKIVMFVILTLIVIVACFNIAGTLITMVIGKTKDIGILKALGAGSGDIRAIFRLEGLFIGIIGTALGSVLGLSLSWAQKAYKIVKVPPDVYDIAALPVCITWLDPVIIAVAAILLSLFATLYPSSRAARLDVIEALRYE
ncbi:MAG: FtsX-like permease family protein [Candidatus Omnitrophota bacterium]|nr:FtsX-like permease family protein [Candidatus Omnitrophota bacterium]